LILLIIRVIIRFGGVTGQGGGHPPPPPGSGAAGRSPAA